MTRCTYLVGDVFDRLAELPDGSVDLVLTSPPFLALRSYLPPDHPDKAKEIGSEPTPADFLDTLLRLTAEWRRVLAPHGSICVELGDTYSGSGGAGGDYAEDGLRAGQNPFDGSARRARRVGDEGGGIQPSMSMPKPGTRQRFQSGPGWPLAKSLCLIPELYRIALVYGFNPLRGPDHPSPAGQWRARNVVRWVRPNPPVGALGDKFRPATSDMVIACVSDRRWFDLTAVRGPASENTHARSATARYDLPSQQRDGNWSTLAQVNSDPAVGAPPLDWWKISPGGYSGSHYAVFPPELLTIPIESMCPREVCRTCGTPRRRVEGGVTLDGYRGSTRPQTIRAVALADAAGLTDAHIAAVHAVGVNDTGKALHVNRGAGKNAPRTQGLADEAKAVLGGYFREFVTTSNLTRSQDGWTDCGHDDYRPGIVLDPFMGSGTTGLVATGHGRDAIGIDLDERNADLARERIGMFLDVIPRGERVA